MNLPILISKRIAKNEAGSFSTIINRIAVVSIAVALAALICTYMILSGFDQTIKQKIFSFSGHLVVSKYSLSTSFEQTSIVAEDSLLNMLSKLDGVDYIQTYAFKAGMLKTDEEVQGIYFKGLDQKFDRKSFEEQHMLKGSFPAFPEKGYSTEVAISQKIASYLRLDVGEEVVIFFVQDPPRFRKLLIKGIYQTGLDDFDEKIVLGDINLVRRINGWEDHTVGGIEIFLKNPDRMDAAEEEVFHQTGSDLYVDKVSDKYVQIFDWLRLVNRNVVIFFVLVLCVASFNMISILLILIMERTQMIGTFKALGANNALMRKVFFFNGLNLIVKGMIWGNAVALLFCVLQYCFKVIPLDAENYYMDHVPINFDLMAVLLINLFITAVTALALFIPLLVISRIKPITAIRFD